MPWSGVHAGHKACLEVVLLVVMLLQLDVWHSFMSLDSLMLKVAAMPTSCAQSTRAYLVHSDIQAYIGHAWYLWCWL